MSKQMEDILRKAMFTLGTAVESVIGKAKVAKQQVGARSGVQPILSVESLIDTARLKVIIDSISRPILEAEVPELKGRLVLELGDGPANMGARLLAHQAGSAYYIEVSGQGSLRAGDSTRGYTLRAKPQALPFRSETFSYAIARLATQHQGDLRRAIVELSRVLIPGAQGVLVDFHPYGLYTKRGHGRIRPAESVISGVEDYYRAFREGGLRVVDIKEGFIDDAARRFFNEEEVSAYRQLKGSPLVAMIFFYKPRQK